MTERIQHPREIILRAAQELVAVDGTADTPANGLVELDEVKPAGWAGRIGPHALSMYKAFAPLDANAAAPHRLSLATPDVPVTSITEMSQRMIRAAEGRRTGERADISSDGLSTPADLRQAERAVSAVIAAARKTGYDPKARGGVSQDVTYPKISSSYISDMFALQEPIRVDTGATVYWDRDEDGKALFTVDGDRHPSFDRLRNLTTYAGKVVYVGENYLDGERQHFLVVDGDAQSIDAPWGFGFLEGAIVVHRQREIHPIADTLNHQFFDPAPRKYKRRLEVDGRAWDAVHEITHRAFGHGVILYVGAMRGIYLNSGAGRKFLGSKLVVNGKSYRAPNRAAIDDVEIQLNGDVTFRETYRRRDGETETRRCRFVPQALRPSALARSIADEK